MPGLSRTQKGAQKELKAPILIMSHNQNWLGRVITAKNGQLAEDFPYEYKKEGSLKVSKTYSQIYENTSPLLNKPLGPRKPLYLLTIPFSSPPEIAPENSDSTIEQKIFRKVQLLYDESFGTEKDSKPDAVYQRIFVAVGMNQFKSIDQRFNEDFVRRVKEFKGFEEVNCEASGFFWKVPLVSKQEKKLLPKKLLKAKQAFRLLQVLYPSKAANLREEMELNSSGGLKSDFTSRIPFCQIRDKIFQSSAVIKLKERMEKTAPKNPIYVVTMDDDTVSLRPKKQGYFTLMDKVITRGTNNKEFPSLVSFGYRLSSDPTKALTFCRISTEIDMAVRETMNRCYPLSCYMPEPGTAYFAGLGTVALAKFLEKGGFLSKSNPSRTMESRRLIENLVEEGLLDPQKALFINQAALITKQPDRFRDDADGFIDIKHEDLKKVKTLNALRNLSQSHFEKRKFSKNFFFSLNGNYKNFQGSAGKLIKPFLKIFAAFDPIELFIRVCSKKWNMDEETAFDAAFALYKDYIDALNDPDFDRSVFDNRETLSRAQIEELILDGKTLMNQAEVYYSDLHEEKGILFSEMDQKKIKEAICQSTSTIHCTLLDILKRAHL
jgi:hypothetical protein